MACEKKTVCAIILAAGVGSRMQSSITKQRMMLGNMTLIKRTVSAFEKCDRINHIIVAVREDEIDFVKSEIDEYKKVVKIIVGGKNRAESAKIAFRNIPIGTDFVAIHDGARAMITPTDISAVVDRAMKTNAATAAVKVVDTVKRVDADGRVIATVERNCLMRAATPQAFKVELYRDAVNAYTGDLSLITDDNMLVELYGENVYCVETSDENIKITTQSDLKFAEFILDKRGEWNV